MKKKLLISLAVVAIFVIIGLTCFFKIRVRKVEKFSTIKILDSYGKEINDFRNNKMPFIIQKQENQIVKVNGKIYEDNERFYESGKYRVEVFQNSKKEYAIVNINSIERSSEHEYNIYISESTLPTFMAMLDIATKGNVQGFLWTQRISSLDTESLKNNTNNLIISEYAGATSDLDVKEKVVPEVKQYIKTILEKDENAYFNLYVDDFRFYLDVELFGKIGLGDNRYSYYLYSDGTSSYVKRFHRGNVFLFREYRIRENNAYQVFKDEKLAYNDLIGKIRANKYKYNDMPGSYMVEKNGGSYNYDYMLLSTLRHNVKYLLQYPQMIDFKDEQVAREMEKANLEKIDLKAQYQKLSQDQKEKFLASIKLDKETLDKEYFVDENAKYLVITGTKPYYGDYSKEEFEEIIKKVAEKYGSEYILLYKPHPNALPDEIQQAFLQTMQIKILPGRIPMEAIMFVYPNLKLGGFASSLYMSAEENQTEFFFANQKEDLVAPLNELYESLFSNAKFYTPKQN